MDYYKSNSENQFKDIQLQLHATDPAPEPELDVPDDLRTKVSNPYTFSIQGNKSFRGVCELDAPYDVVAYGKKPWYYDYWVDASNVSDLTINSSNTSAKFNAKDVESAAMMFYYCSGLTALDLSNFNTSSVTNMNSMFMGCKKLTSLDLSNFNTRGVRYMNYMFSDCRELTSLDLSNFDTGNASYMTNMFNGCISLQILDYSLTGFEVNGVAPDLSGCTNLKTLRLHHVTPSYVNSFITTAKVPSTCNVIVVS